MLRVQGQLSLKRDRNRRLLRDTNRRRVEKRRNYDFVLLLRIKWLHNSARGKRDRRVNPKERQLATRDNGNPN